MIELTNMYNWSVDEKQFKDVKEIINFLKAQAEMISVKTVHIGDEESVIIKTKLTPTIHPARKFFIAKFIQERLGDMNVSVIEER